MNCLNCENKDQLGNDEIGILVETLKNMRNISAGESETVIGLSYVLLTRLVLSTSEAGQIFRGEIMETTMQSSVLGSSIAESNSNYDVSRNDDVGDEDDEEDDYIDPDENAPVNNDVSLSNASIAIITAMRILVQNASRDTGDDHDEALEKAEAIIKKAMISGPYYNVSEYEN